MVTTIISNGVIRLVLTPENDIEKIALKELKTSSFVVKIEAAADGVQILGKTIPDSIIISLDKEAEKK